MEAEGLGAVVEGAEGEVVAAVARAAVARHVRLRLVLRRACRRQRRQRTTKPAIMNATRRDAERGVRSSSCARAASGLRGDACAAVRRRPMRVCAYPTP